MDEDSGVIVVFVNWSDSYYAPDLDAADEDGLPVITTGFLVGVSDTSVKVALELYKNGEIGDVITIPRGVINRMTIWEAGTFKELIDGKEEVTPPIQGITYWPESSAEKVDAQTDESGGLEGWSWQKP